MDNTSTYETHFHAAACGYLVLATDGTILDINQTLLGWTGHSRENLLGKNVTDIMPLGDQVLYASYAVPQLALSGCFDEMAADLMSAAGEHIPVLLSGVRSASGDGGDVGMDRIAVFNASERRRYERELVAALRKAEAAEAAMAAAEEKLREKQSALEEKDRVLKTNLAASREREALLNAVLNAVDVGLLVVDADGNIVLTNAHLMSAWNRIAGDVYPDGTRPIFGPDRLTPVSDAESPLRRAVAGESFSNQLLWFGSGGKQQIALSVSGRPIKTDGVLSGSVVAYNDVSPLVHALAAQEEFVASVSHELRTPLTSILGYLDLALDEEGLSPAVSSALNVAVRNSERLLALVSDLLSVASGTKRMELRPVNLAEIVRAGVVSAAPKAASNHVDVESEIPASLVAEVDPQRLAQVVDNLLSNAVKYSPDGGTVRVQLLGDGQEVRLVVADTGVGMSVEEQAMVFTKFFRAPSAVASAVPGAGLGLVITKNIVEAHGGAVSVVSSPGKGSVFTVLLPALQKAQSLPPAELRPVP